MPNFQLDKPCHPHQSQWGDMYLEDVQPNDGVHGMMHNKLVGSESGGSCMRGRCSRCNGGYSSGTSHAEVLAVILQVAKEPLVVPTLVELCSNIVFFVVAVSGPPVNSNNNNNKICPASDRSFFFCSAKANSRSAADTWIFRRFDFSLVPTTPHHWLITILPCMPFVCPLLFQTGATLGLHVDAQSETHFQPRVAPSLRDQQKHLPSQLVISRSTQPTPTFMIT